MMGKAAICSLIDIFFLSKVDEIVYNIYQLTEKHLSAIDHTPLLRVMDCLLSPSSITDRTATGLASYK